MTGGMRGRSGGMVLAVVLAIAAVAGAAATEPTPGAARPAATSEAPPEPGDRGAQGEGRCPSIAAVDPGFYPSDPEGGVDPDRIDPGFAPLPEPLPGRIAGEEIDPSFVAPFPPCRSTEGTPAAGGRVGED